MSYIEPSNRLWSELAGIAAEEGLCLYDAERAGQKGLRIFVQRQAAEKAVTEAEESVAVKPAGKPGATSEDCVRLCKRLMRYFLVEGPELGLTAEPFIEVSSPGLNRQLRLAEHFGSAVGEMADVHLHDPIVDENGVSRNHVFGTLKRVENGTIDLQVDSGKTISFSLTELKKARVKF